LSSIILAQARSKKTHGNGVGVCWGVVREKGGLEMPGEPGVKRVALKKNSEVGPLSSWNTLSSFGIKKEKRRGRLSQGGEPR